MYRPLYWFGRGRRPTSTRRCPSAELAGVLQRHQDGQVDLKNYKWSNGETVTAQDVVFWMNMMHAEKTNWAPTSRRDTIPDNVQRDHHRQPDPGDLHLTGAVNTNWYTYNKLSQITPMPKAWDITSTGARRLRWMLGAAYGTADTACTTVYTFLSKQAGYDPANPKATNNSLATYATNPIWQVVDGPWHLTYFDALGRRHDGAQPQLHRPQSSRRSEFKEVPFTSDPAEFNALVAGKVKSDTCPTQDIRPPRQPLAAGPTTRG